MYAYLRHVDWMHPKVLVFDNSMPNPFSPNLYISIYIYTRYDTQCLFNAFAIARLQVFDDCHRNDWIAKHTHTQFSGVQNHCSYFVILVCNFRLNICSLFHCSMNDERWVAWWNARLNHDFSKAQLFCSMKWKSFRSLSFSRRRWGNRIHQNVRGCWLALGVLGH